MYHEKTSSPVFEPSSQSLVTWRYEHILFSHLLSPPDGNSEAANVVMDTCVQRCYKV